MFNNLLNFVLGILVGWFVFKVVVFNGYCLIVCLLELMCFGYCCWFCLVGSALVLGCSCSVYLVCLFVLFCLCLCLIVLVLFLF